MSLSDFNARGNIFLALFGVVALVGLIGVGVSQFIRGPLTASTNISRTNLAMQQMTVAAQLIIATSATQTNNGDCETATADSYIEPLEYRDPAANPHPTGGGYIPNSVGATKTDPWGTEYGYCVWDAGSIVTSDNNAGCGGAAAKRLDGAKPSVAHPTKPNTQAVVALISAGKDKAFNTTCNAFVDANDDAIADTTLVAKTAGKDDIIVQYTYSEAQSAGGDLWVLKSGDPTTATISKDVEIASNQSLVFGNDARLILPTDVELTNAECTGVAASHVNAGALRLNTTTSPPSLEVCYDSDPTAAFAWAWGSAGGGVAAIDDLSDAITDYASLYNLFMGDTAGDSVTTGSYNVGIGQNVLTANTTGNVNVVMGYRALYTNTTGSYNAALGAEALLSNTTGSYNAATGHWALYSNTTGWSNTALGAAALFSNTTGSYNTAIGVEALYWNTTGTYNTAIGKTALAFNTTGSYNTATGHWALLFNTTGSYNTATGFGALYNNTVGSHSITIGRDAAYQMVTAADVSAGDKMNIALGYQSLYGGHATAANNTGYRNIAMGYRAMYGTPGTALTGYENIAIGSAALQNITTGYYNTAIGKTALANNTTGYDNTALGAAALFSNTTGSYNTALGVEALYWNTTGSYNTALGVEALYWNTTGASNTATGFGALNSNTVGSHSIAIGTQAAYQMVTAADVSAGDKMNIALGYQSLYGGSATAANNTGYRNIALGYRAMYGTAGTALTGYENVAIGTQALQNITSGTYNTAIGRSALTANTTGTYNTAIGRSALTANTTGNNNLAIGPQTLTANTTGFYNLAIGYSALYSNTTGASNAAIGTQALYSNTTGASNTAIGTAALYYNSIGSHSIAIGRDAAYQMVTAADVSAGDKMNIAVGYQSLYGGSATAANNTGYRNIALGYRAMYGTPGTALTGAENVAIGTSALQNITTGAYNVALGPSALQSNTTGANNTALGYQAGAAGTANTTGSNNTFIGYQAQANANNYTNGTALGNGAVLTASNRIVLGNTSIADIYAQVTTITGISDARKKHDIRDLDLGLDFISALRPVAYRYNNGDDTLRYGFIAQETEKVLPGALKPLVNKNTGGLALLTREEEKDRTYRMAYGELTAPIVKAIQEQQKMIEALSARMTAQEKSGPQAMMMVDPQGLSSVTPAAGGPSDGKMARLESWVVGLMAALGIGIFALFCSVLANIVLVRQLRMRAG